MHILGLICKAIRANSLTPKRYFGEGLDPFLVRVEDVHHFKEHRLDGEYVLEHDATSPAAVEVEVDERRPYLLAYYL